MELANNVYIVGAGFSFNAGLPLASGFTQAMLTPATALSGGGANEVLNKAIRRFVDDVFGDGTEKPHDQWPPLEDIFTIIDLAANSGHNLGKAYPPSALRTMRRALIVRFMRMLRIAYSEKVKAPDDKSRKLDEFIDSVDLSSTAFLSLNWDTVLEAKFEKSQKVSRLDYGCGATRAGFSADRSIEKISSPADGVEARILKPHGSINWMYCDSCSRLFWFKPSDTPGLASRIFKPADLDFVKSAIGVTPKFNSATAACPDCHAEALGTRFATFSYRKALEFPMHQSTWREAERQLRHARNWIFIGYSMPPADYEFKFLLKRVQLSRVEPPNVIVVTSGGPTSPTGKTYRAFFGERTIPVGNMHTDELNDAAIAALRLAGALKTAVPLTRPAATGRAATKKRIKARRPAKRA